ncbi:MAG TPA: addiction module toxin RelE [Thermoanaerobaculia bacterium]|nr:addiction module toxin RelE [Thermoanaerobaculia bacterium]
MPKAWSNKDERQYEHIKKSAKKKGRSTRRAKEIAAATVNKERSKEGRTKSKKSGRAKKSSSRKSSSKRSKKSSKPSKKK